MTAGGSSLRSAARERAATLAVALAAARRVAFDAREPFDATRLDRRDPAVIEALLPALELLNREWLRLRVDGLEHLRPGPMLLVGNHNGGVMGPDLACTMATLWRTLGSATPLYAMAHDFAMRHVTPLGRVLQATGAMRADPANAERVLAAGHPVLAYPGGDLDAFRHFRDRDRIVFGPRTGFVRLAQRARVPIVPIVAQGAHRSAVILHEGAWLAEALGLTRWSRLQRFPIALGLPWGLAVGPWVPFLPLPLPIRLRVLPPIEAPPGEEPGPVRDEVVRRMQAAMDELARERR